MTEGIFSYQEQLMKAFMKCCGYTEEEAAALVVVLVTAGVAPLAASDALLLLSVTSFLAALGEAAVGDNEGGVSAVGAPAAVLVI